jgi:hypothetical protein
VVEKELRSAIARVREVLDRTRHEGLFSALDGFEFAIETPGREEARLITQQPLPTGQIPSDQGKEFGQ